MEIVMTEKSKWNEWIIKIVIYDNISSVGLQNLG